MIAHRWLPVPSAIWDKALRDWVYEHLDFGVSGTKYDDDEWMLTVLERGTDRTLMKIPFIPSSDSLEPSLYHALQVTATCRRAFRALEEG